MCFFSSHRCCCTHAQTVLEESSCCTLRDGISGVSGSLKLAAHGDDLDCQTTVVFESVSYGERERDLKEDFEAKTL